ncbi:hypothetical protein CQA65_30745, partial [Klebsiella pneumoniae]
TENVAMTIRGLQVPGPLIGGAARMMSPNADWAPVLPIRQTENVAMTIRGLQVPGPLIGGAARMMSPNADWAP